MVGKGGSRPMAGHAPEVWSVGRRALRWWSEASDVVLSIAMLSAAGCVIALIYVLNQRFFA